MKVTVIEMFQDKYTNEYYEKGQTMEMADTKRVDELVKAKVVEVTEMPEASKTRGKKNDKPRKELCERTEVVR